MESFVAYLRRHRFAAFLLLAIGSIGGAIGFIARGMYLESLWPMLVLLFGYMVYAMGGNDNQGSSGS